MDSLKSLGPSAREEQQQQEAVGGGRFRHTAVGAGQERMRSSKLGFKLRSTLWFGPMLLFPQHVLASSVSPETIVNFVFPLHVRETLVADWPLSTSSHHSTFSRLSSVRQIWSPGGRPIYHQPDLQCAGDV